MTNLSKDQVALYDRQIRLWGLEAQKKIVEGSVLIVAKEFTLIVKEISKNLALSGIGKLTVYVESTGNLDEHVSTVNEIHPSMECTVITCKQQDPLSGLQDRKYDFVVVVGPFLAVEVESINSAARRFDIPNAWCSWMNRLLFLFNDPIGMGQDNPFPSFSEVLNRSSIIATERNLRNEKLQDVWKFITAEKRNAEELGNLELPYQVGGSSIMGAIVTQEILKSFSRKDLPINNMLILEPETLKSSITCL